MARAYNDVSTVGFEKSCQRIEQFSLALPFERRDPDDFSWIDRDLDSAEAIVYLKPFHRDDRFLSVDRRRAFARERLIERATDHEFHQFSFIDAVTAELLHHHAICLLYTSPSPRD